MNLTDALKQMEGTNLSPQEMVRAVEAMEGDLPSLPVLRAMNLIYAYLGIVLGAITTRLVIDQSSPWLVALMGVGALWSAARVRRTTGLAYWVGGFSVAAQHLRLTITRLEEEAHE